MGYAVMQFANRRSAGRSLAEHLRSALAEKPDIVLALPRGGVPVGYEVAQALDIPLDVFIVRKLGVPGYPELAMGAIATGGVQVLNPEIVGRGGIHEQAIRETAERELAEIGRRERLYRGNRPPLEVEGKRVLVVDDGLATGASMRAAVAALKALGAKEIIVAVPVAPPDTLGILSDEADAVHCVLIPEGFAAVGQFYEDFSQTTDAEVQEILHPGEKSEL